MFISRRFFTETQKTENSFAFSGVIPMLSVVVM